MGHHRGPANTVAMMTGVGPYGNLEMGGMFTVLKVRDGLAPGDFRDPGWYAAPKATIAHCVSQDPDFGRPIRRPGSVPSHSSVKEIEPQRHDQGDAHEHR